MGLLDAIILGVVQGLTEFVPVSSSGHLILAREVLNISKEGSLLFDVMLHFATALAVLIYFRRDIWGLVTCARDYKSLWAALIFGTIPAVLFGLSLGDGIIGKVRSAEVLAWALIGGSILFVLAEYFGSRVERLSTKKGLLIGLYQSLAFIPGVSRSGATISGGMLFGLNREEATRFAFLLGFPILFGAGILKLFEFLQTGVNVSGEGLALLTGSVVAFGVGLGAIHFMLKFLRAHSLYFFAVYRVVLAIIVFIFL